MTIDQRMDRSLPLAFVRNAHQVALGTTARLLLGDFFEVINQFTGRRKACLAHGARLFHRRASASVWRLERKRKLLVRDDARQEDANGVVSHGRASRRSQL